MTHAVSFFKEKTKKRGADDGLFCDLLGILAPALNLTGVAVSS